MKKRAKITLSWALSILLSGAGAFASQAPQQVPRMVFVESAVRVFAMKFKLGEEKQEILKNKLDEVATQEHKIDIDVAREIALAVRDMHIPKTIKRLEKKIKRPEEDIVAQFLPIPGVAAEVGTNLPLRWNMQFKPGEVSRQFGRGLILDRVRACANGQYLAIERILSIEARSIVLWDMLKMEPDMTLSYTILYNKSRPVWDISPQGDMLIYQADGDIVGVNLRGWGDNRELFRKKAENVDSLSFSWDGKFVFGYTREEGAVVAWDASTGDRVPAESIALNQSLSKLSMGKKLTGSASGYSILSSDGKKLAIIKWGMGTYEEKIIEIWDVGTQTLQLTINADDKRNFDAESCVLDGGSNKIAVISREGEKSIVDEGKLFLEVWDVATGIRECNEPQKNTRYLSFLGKIVFSPDGLWLVTTFHNEGGFKIWSLAALREKYAAQASRSGIEPGTHVPTKRVTVEEFMETLALEGVPLMEEDLQDEVRKQLREYAQTSPDKKIDESLGEHIVNVTLHVHAPRELAEQSDEDMPPLEEVSGGEGEEKEGAVEQPVRRLTVAQARKEFGTLSTDKQRDFWEKELNKLAAKSKDIKVDYKDAERLFEEIQSLGSF